MPDAPVESISWNFFELYNMLQELIFFLDFKLAVKLEDISIWGHFMNLDRKQVTTEIRNLKHDMISRLLSLDYIKITERCVSIMIMFRSN